MSCFSGEQDEVSRLFKIRRTVMQMLRDRGYEVDEETDINMSRTQFLEQFQFQGGKREELFIHKAKAPPDPANEDYEDRLRDPSSDQIFVFFPDEPKKIGVKIMKACFARMSSENVFRAILVSQKALTPPANQAVKEMSSKFHLEAFVDEELLVNINYHCLVPKHNVLSTKEKKALLHKYSLKETQLPRMKISDPIAKYHGLKCGQVVKITRKSVTAETYDTYRVVV